LWRLNWIHAFADGNGRTARAVSYVVLSISLNSLLPGTPTIPDQIASDKNPYYEALEAADLGWKETGQVDVSAMEHLLGMLLAKQLVSAADQAVGSEST
jgi:Fic family protein